MMHQRTRMLIGDEGLQTLGDARVAVFGLGGVGGRRARCSAVRG
jgi:tRNA A37 threonylcarbamoyladenosine dehydratase